MKVTGKLTGCVIWVHGLSKGYFCPSVISIM